jgi:ABC-type Mn2+/Zn2+ transport system permease subunit
MLVVIGMFDAENQALLRNGFANAVLATLLVAASMLMGNALATTVVVGVVLGYFLIGARRVDSPWWTLGAVLPPLLVLAAFISVVLSWVLPALLRHGW